MLKQLEATRPLPKAAWQDTPSALVDVVLKDTVLKSMMASGGGRVGDVFGCRESVLAECMSRDVV